MPYNTLCYNRITSTRKGCVVMSDTQIIKGVTVPVMQEDVYQVYPYGDVRNDGTDHESNRIIVRVRRKKGWVELLAVGDGSYVRGKFIIELPAVGTSRMATIAAATRFTFELNQALKNCAEALRGASQLDFSIPIV